MAEFRGQALALAAERLKEAAAAENVYVSLARATRIAAPVIDTVAPLLLADETIERTRAAEQAALQGDAPTTLPPPLSPADSLDLRRERMEATVRRIARAAELHDLSDIDLGTLPPEMRTVMAAYADCQLHLRKASSLLRGLVAQEEAPRRQQRTSAAVWSIEPAKAKVGGRAVVPA